jgi:hypothetical protein
VTARRCQGTSKSGKPCRATPLRDQDWCNGHAPNLPESARFQGGAKPGAGRPPKARPSDIARRLVEENVAVVLRPHFRTLGHDVEISGDGLRLVPVEGGGAKLHGTSKDGEVVVSAHDDLGAQVTASERIQDRLYGKPRQALEHTGPDGGPIELEDVVGLDLRRLTDDELEALQRLVDRATPQL